MTPSRREFFESDEPSGNSGSGEPDQPIVPPTIIGLHHVKVPVGDVLRSRDWYAEVLGFTPVLEFEEEDRLIGVALQHPCGLTIGLHLDPKRAAVLCGFPTVALCVGDVDDLVDWSAYLDGRSIEHSPMLEGHPRLFHPTRRPRRAARPTPHQRPAGGRRSLNQPSETYELSLHAVR
jgi:catechol 2,3-dioxygenase-like lactoylglutathione lyase family enzyme